MPAIFTIPVIGGDPVPPSLGAYIAALTDLAASALLSQAELSETETEAQVRDQVLSYLDTAIDRSGHALSPSHTAPVFHVVVACPECGTRRTLRETEPEIAAAGISAPSALMRGTPGPAPNGEVRASRSR